MGTPAVVATATTLGQADAAAGSADLVEVRFDRAAIDVEMALDGYRGELPLLLTDRIGRHPDRPAAASARLEAIAAVVDDDRVWGVDIDHGLLAEPCNGLVTEAALRLVEAVEDAEATTLVCSMHPDDELETPALAERLEAAAEVGDIAKLAVPVSTPRGLGYLVEVTAAATDADRAIATMATGRYALPSRVLAAGLGCALVYGVPAGTPPVAPGQPSVATLRRVVDALRSG